MTNHRRQLSAAVNALAEALSKMSAQVSGMSTQASQAGRTSS